MATADHDGGVGRDGLTVEALRATRERWWDDDFSQLVAEAIPTVSTIVVEIGCGLGHAAPVVLARAPLAQYIGVDIDEERLRLTREPDSRSEARR